LDGKKIQIVDVNRLIKIANIEDWVRVEVVDRLV
jgi:hypothetical protein